MLHACSLGWCNGALLVGLSPRVISDYSEHPSISRSTATCPRLRAADLQSYRSPLQGRSSDGCRASSEHRSAMLFSVVAEPYPPAERQLKVASSSRVASQCLGAGP